MQFRYDGNDSNFNYPNTITRDVLTGSNIFANKNIIQLGIQATPSTRFRLNHTERTINNGGWIVIGTSGIYELNVEEIKILSTEPYDEGIEEYGNYLNKWQEEYNKRMKNFKEKYQ